MPHFHMPRGRLPIFLPASIIWICPCIPSRNHPNRKSSNKGEVNCTNRQWPPSVVPSQILTKSTPSITTSSVDIWYIPSCVSTIYSDDTRRISMLPNSSPPRTWKGDYPWECTSQKWENVKKHLPSPRIGNRQRRVNLGLSMKILCHILLNNALEIIHLKSSNNGQVNCTNLQWPPSAVPSQILTKSIPSITTSSVDIWYIPSYVSTIYSDNTRRNLMLPKPFISTEAEENVFHKNGGTLENICEACG